MRLSRFVDMQRAKQLPVDHDERTREHLVDGDDSPHPSTEDHLQNPQNNDHPRQKFKITPISFPLPEIIWPLHTLPTSSIPTTEFHAFPFQPATQQTILSADLMTYINISFLFYARIRGSR